MFKPVQRKDSVTEFFFSEKFIQSEEWNKLNLSQPCYTDIGKNYIKDYIKYQENPVCQDLTYSLNFSEIIHATHQRELLSIINDGGFKPGQKTIPDCDINSFVWFGMKIDKGQVDAYTNYYQTQCMMEKNDILGQLGLIDETDCRSIVNSPCFEPMSRYGEFKLTFEIRNVINAYRRQFCRKNQEASDWPKPEFRILGTFAYKMETMHTVLVCPPGTPGTSKYPLLDQKKTPVICEDPEKEGTFKWSPDSTGDKDKATETGYGGPYRRWEHVTFAFHVPAGKILKLDDVSSNLSICIWLNWKQNFQPSSINVTIRTFLERVSECRAIKTKRWLVNLLIRSLRGYLDEEKVFEKMNILYTYQPIDLAAAVYRVEELLVGEEFDWSPLIEWMKDVQQTKNKAVLCSILNYLDQMKEICTTKLTDNGVPQ